MLRARGTVPAAAIRCAAVDRSVQQSVNQSGQTRLLLGFPSPSGFKEFVTFSGGRQQSLDCILKDGQSKPFGQTRHVHVSYVSSRSKSLELETLLSEDIYVVVERLASSFSGASWLMLVYCFLRLSLVFSPALTSDPKISTRRAGGP